MTCQGNKFCGLLWTLDGHMHATDETRSVQAALNKLKDEYYRCSRCNPLDIRVEIVEPPLVIKRPHEYLCKLELVPTKPSRWRQFLARWLGIW